jgi:exosome complex component RRP4
MTEKTKTNEKLHASDRQIVIPGDLLAEGMSYLPGRKAIREKDKIIATSLGLTNIKGRVIKVIPLAGRYIPKRGDAIIGKITGISKHGWYVNISCPFDADLNISEASSRYIDTRRTPMNKILDVGELIFANVVDITESRYVRVSIKFAPYRKLIDGITIKVSPTKIPRIIGKQGSMIKLLKDYSGCDIIVGQNGWVWIRSENPEKQLIVVNAIKKIENESHLPGLTDKIKTMLAKTEVKK